MSITVRFLLLSLLAAAPAAAQVPAAEYAARRDSVAARIGDGLVLAFGAREPVDDMALYRQLPSFHYLTGFHEPDAAFVMVARNGRVQHATVFLPPRDPRLALYNGFLPDSADVRREYGFGMRTMDYLRPVVDSLLALGLPLWHVPDIATRDVLQRDSLTRGTRFIEQLRARVPRATVHNAQALLDSLRVRKSAGEIALLRKAIDITMQGFDSVLRVIEPGVSEAVVQAEADRVFRTLGDGTAYGGIVGSGANSTSYHYRANNRVMQAGDVVVMDMGAIYQGYTADITRTAPVSGTFTPEQRRIYDIVLESQAAAERVARPGVRVAVGDSAIRAVHARRLAELGLIESPDATLDAPWNPNCTPNAVNCKQYFLFMAHGPGHGIGLEVHDAGGYSYSPTGIFQVGEVFTIEPGIYISTKLLDMLPDTPKNRAFIAKVRPAVERYNNIGVRIEDDYVITADGVEWLSRAPRTADEIEAAMRGVKASQ